VSAWCDLFLRYGPVMGFNNFVMTLIFLILFLLWLFVVLIFLLYKLHLGRVERRRMRRLIERLRLSNSKLSRYVDLDDLTRCAIASVFGGADRPP
jgi:ABC-type bacteriocin/lantibiotic exporter with double-glycine peptidase domain